MIYICIECFYKFLTSISNPILGMIKNFTLYKNSQTSHFRGQSVTCHFFTMTFDCSYGSITIHIMFPYRSKTLMFLNQVLEIGENLCNTSKRLPARFYQPFHAHALMILPLASQSLHCLPLKPTHSHEKQVKIKSNFQNPSWSNILPTDSLQSRNQFELYPSTHGAYPLVHGTQIPS